MDLLRLGFHHSSLHGNIVCSFVPSCPAFCGNLSLSAPSLRRAVKIKAFNDRKSAQGHWWRDMVEVFSLDGCSLSPCWLHTLGPSHTKSPSMDFEVVHQRQYKILLLRPVCGACATQQLVLISVAWRQKHMSHGIELVLFLMPDTWY